MSSCGCEALRAASWIEKGRILDELYAVTGWHTAKHAIRVPAALRRVVRRLFSSASAVD